MAFIFIEDKDEFCRSWDKNGKSDFVHTCKAFVDQHHIAVEDVEYKGLKRALYELCWLAIHGQLKVEQVSSALVEIADMHLEVSSVLADLFCAIDVELMCGEDAECHGRFVRLVSACQAVVPENLLKERLDSDTFETMGLVQSKAAFQQKYVKTKTKLYYKQQKFNLLREESEGYAKLITELSQDVPYKVVLQNIQSLIGCFNLDPNRVLDIILESFECRPDQSSLFIPLLREYATNVETLCHILGFKFHFYQQTDDCETPDSLFLVTAELIQSGLVDLKLVYAHLKPSDVIIAEDYNKQVASAKEYLHKSAVVQLVEKTEKSESKDKDEKIEGPSNQKFGLCKALMKIGAWQSARCIMDSLPQYSVVADESVAKSLCELIHAAVEPLYKEHSGLSKAIACKRFLPKNVVSAVQSKTFCDLNETVFPMLRKLGPNLAHDPVLLVKINRLAKTYMEKKAQLKLTAEEESDVLAGFLSVYDEVILPSLSLLPMNCCMAEEIWGFIKQLNYEYRYCLYGNWKNASQTSSHCLVIRAHADILNKSKYVMKRLSKENIKPLGRQLGKLSHSAPGIVFEYILSQIQKYDNFIGPVVDSLKYLSNMSYDVLLFIHSALKKDCVVEALANPERERLKTDDTNISFWLQCLANFSGCVLKKYQIDTSGLLQYIANQLKAQKSYDLAVLRDVVQKMASIEISEEVTSDQLLAMCGSELLRQEGGYFTQVRNTKKSSSRLMDSLLENDLAIPLCLLMAQQRQGIIFPPVPTDSLFPYEDKRHLKLIGKLYDQCQDTLAQFVTFLTLQLNSEELVKRLPNITDLLTTYHIPPVVAFALWRPVYAASIEAKFEKAEKKDKNALASPSAKIQRYIDVVTSVMQPVQNLVSPLLEPKLWTEMSLSFFTTFWSLSTYDLIMPSSVYEKQIQLLRAQSALEDEKDGSQSKKKKDKERVSLIVDKLIEEEKRQQEHVKLVLDRLNSEKDTWFPSKQAKHALIQSFLQQCIFPRVCFTAVDAIYCARFLYLLHNLKTPNFSSLICFDRIFSDITCTMSSCTENEAHRYGRFLCAILDYVMKWHGDKSVFEKECGSFPGFVTVFRAPGPGSFQNFADQLDYENFRHVVHKWHYSLTKVAVNSLESGDFMQIRNMIIVLTKILPHYPRVSKFGQALERRVERVVEEEKEKRQDIYVLAIAYLGQLKNSKKGWVQDLEFHKKEFESRAPPSTQASGTSASGNATSASNGSSTAATSSVTTASASKVSVKSEPVDKGPATSSTAGVTQSAASDQANRRQSAAVNGKQPVKESRETPDRSREKTDKKDSELEKADKERKQEAHGRERKGAEVEKEMKREERDEKSRAADKSKGGDDRQKDRSHRTEGVRGDGDKARISDRDASANDGAAADIQTNESQRRSADTAKPVDERDPKRRKIDVAPASKESPSQSDLNDKHSKMSAFNSEKERAVTSGERSTSGVRNTRDGDVERKSSRSEKHERKRLSNAVDPDSEDIVQHRDVKRHRSVESSSPSGASGKDKINGSEGLRDYIRDEKRSGSREVEVGRLRDSEQDKPVRKKDEITSSSRLSSRDGIRDDMSIKETMRDDEDPTERPSRGKDDLAISTSRDRHRHRDEESGTQKGGEERKSEKRSKKSKHR